jgi:hypothetical protein
MRRFLALKPFCSNRSCTAAANSLIFGGFLPAASAASYSDLISSLIMAVEADGFNCPGDRLGWLSPSLASDHHEGLRNLCRRAKSSTASLDSKMTSPIVRNSPYSRQPSMYLGWPLGSMVRKPKRLPQQLGGDMVEERGELLLLYAAGLPDCTSRVSKHCRSRQNRADGDCSKACRETRKLGP